MNQSIELLNGLNLTEANVEGLFLLLLMVSAGVLALVAVIRAMGKYGAVVVAVALVAAGWSVVMWRPGLLR
jgi:hypothetical protein